MSRELNLSINGYQIAAIEYGSPDGFPVLALHGWLDNAASFSPMGRSLDGIRLIALDLVGHGLSDHRPSVMPYHIWDNVTDLDGVIKVLGLKKVSLLGHSMGASIAMLYAGAFPDRVQKLCLIEGLAPLTYASADLPNLFAGALSKRHKMAARKDRTYASFDAVIEARMKGRWPLERKNAELLLRRGTLSGVDGVKWSHDSKLLMPSLVRFSEEQVTAFIRSVRADTLLITGSEGGAAQLVDGWSESLQHVTRYRLQGGHHLHMDEPNASQIAGLINNWAV